MNVGLLVVLLSAALQDSSAAHRRALEVLLARPDSTSTIQCRIVSRESTLRWTEHEIIVDTVARPRPRSEYQVPGRRRMSFYYVTLGRVMVGSVTEFSMMGDEHAAVLLSRARASGLRGEGYVRVVLARTPAPLRVERALTPSDIARFDSLSIFMRARACQDRAR